MPVLGARSDRAARAVHSRSIEKVFQCIEKLQADCVTQMLTADNDALAQNKSSTKQGRFLRKTDGRDSMYGLA